MNPSSSTPEREFSPPNVPPLGEVLDAPKVRAAPLAHVAHPHQRRGIHQLSG